MDLQRIKSYKLSIMELRHLRYFVKVASELHFGRAAEALGISQPPLSQQIRLLEQELGVQLFERSSRKVRLTTAGRLFLDEARATLERADHAVSVTRRAAAGEIGELAIGISASTLYCPCVSEAIMGFRARYPDVHLVFTEKPMEAQREAMASGALDIGFVRRRTMPPMPPGVIATCVLTDRMVVAMPRSHRLANSDEPIDPAALAGEPIVHYPYDRDGFMADIHSLFGSVGLPLQLAIETNEMSTLLGLVAAGVGISVLAGPLRRLEVDTLHYRPVSGDFALSTMWMLHRGDRSSPQALAFAALVDGETVGQVGALRTR